MAQAPQPPHRPAPGPAKPPPPLKDPAEGKPPAIGGGHLAKTGEPHVDERDRPLRPGDPQPIGVSGLLIEDGERDPGTVAEEQRARSAEIETMGVEAYKDSIDERSEVEKNEHPTVALAPQRYGSDDEPLPEGQRKVEHHVEGSKK